MQVLAPAPARRRAARNRSVTAAHCFANFRRNESVSVMSLSGFSLKCHLERVFESPNDLAVLSCPHAAATSAAAAAAAAAPPLLLRSSGFRLGLAVAAAGFVDDAFAGTPRFSLPKFPAISLKLTFARIANVAGYWNNVTCDVLQSSPATPVQWRVNAAGFVDGLVTRGMSGGPLLDLRCGVVGVLHGKGCESSIFMGLDAVDAYLAQQRSAAAGAGNAG